MIKQITTWKCSKRFIFASLILVNVLVLCFYQGVFRRIVNTDMTIENGLTVNQTQQDRSFIFDTFDKIKSAAIAVLPQFDEGGDIRLDIHLEDPVFGHAGEVTDHVSPSTTSINIAIGGGLTSRNVAGLTAVTVGRLQVFSSLLPSFCKTASNGYHYHFYFGYDNSDAFFTKAPNLMAFQKQFIAFSSQHCPKSSNYSLHFVQCVHNKRPAWAQNDAMFEAYIDGMDYYYRVNDDTDMVTKGWTEAFIKVLDNYTPKNVGVVGPKHRGGNQVILTYDFVHRTHVDIFGFYYPRLFTDWWADDWVTKVYLPGRSTKLPTILLTHTMRLGQRYKLVDRNTGGRLSKQLADDKVTLNRFIEYCGFRSSNTLPKEDGTKVIAMSLYGKNTTYTYGAIRNAQLAPVIYPGWKLRFYVADPQNQNQTENLRVPGRILRKLKSLGAEIAIMGDNIKMDPKYWRYLVVEDSSVETFLVRDVHAHLSDREKVAVERWLSTPAVFHSIKDHPKHSSASVVEGLWAAKRSEFVQLLPKTMRQVIGAGGDILQKVIWPAVGQKALCHDSVTCTKKPECKPYPVQNREKTWLGLQYVGQKYDSYMQPLGKDSAELNSVPGAEKCVSQ